MVNIILEKFIKEQIQNGNSISMIKKNLILDPEYNEEVFLEVINKIIRENYLGEIDNEEIQKRNTIFLFASFSAGIIILIITAIVDSRNVKVPQLIAVLLVIFSVLQYFGLAKLKRQLEIIKDSSKESKRNL